MNSHSVLSNRRLLSQWLPLLAGSLSLVLSVAITPLVLAQTPPPMPPDRAGHGQDRLNLTEEQRTQLEQIRQETQAQMDSILTEEQKAQLETARANGEHPRQIFASLDLTEEQRSQIEELHRASREQMATILTPEQLEQMQRHHRDRSPHSEQPPQ